MMYGYRQQDMETYGKRVIHRRTLHACFEPDQCGSHRQTLCLIWVNIVMVPQEPAIHQPSLSVSCFSIPVECLTPAIAEEHV
jgi:hypothetical protein